MNRARKMIYAANEAAQKSENEKIYKEQSPPAR